MNVIYTFKEDITPELANTYALTINKRAPKVLFKTGLEWPKYITFAKSCLEDKNFNIEVDKIFNADEFKNPQRIIGAAIEGTIKAFFDEEVLLPFSDFDGLQLFTEMKKVFKAADSFTKIEIHNEFVNNMDIWDLQVLLDKGITATYYIPALTFFLNVALINRVPSNLLYSFLCRNGLHEPGVNNKALEDADSTLLYTAVVELFNDKDAY